MQGLITSIAGSPALPFLALSGAVGTILAVWGKTRPLFSPMAGWGLFAFLATHLIAESWRLSGVLEAQVRIFGISLFLMAALYAIILRKQIILTLLVAVILLLAATTWPIEMTAQIRRTWLALSIIIVLYCALIFCTIPKQDLLARLIWIINMVSDGITVVEQIDCQLMPGRLHYFPHNPHLDPISGAARAFEHGASCAYAWNPLLDLDFSYWLYAAYTLPLIWIIWVRFRT